MQRQEFKQNLSSINELQTHIELFIDMEGYITTDSINDVFAELLKFEREREINELLKTGKEKEAKQLKSTPMPSLDNEGKKVMVGARYIFCIAGSRFLQSRGKMLPKDVIAMMHPNDTGFYQKNGFLNEAFIKLFLKDDSYFKLDETTGERVITRERVEEFIRKTKTLAEERWKKAGDILKKIGPGAHDGEFDFMFRFFYSYKDSDKNRVITDKDFYLFFKNTIALYEKKYPQSHIVSVAYFSAGLKLPQPKETCCIWLENGVKGLLFSARSQLASIMPSSVPMLKGQEKEASFQQKAIK